MRLTWQKGKKEEDENQLQGFWGAAWGEGQTREVADDCEAHLQVRERVAVQGLLAQGQSWPLPTEWVDQMKAKPKAKHQK